ncbi:MAG TPA: lytic transglycosylase domain-containing protein [Chitinophagales bacterium]|nr:lytic transglycosylase domain-containing protein [Chitinophagales bacterium]HQO89254.1 lytic transglycosylase domain-containing protein [Chitinophagales bacterium]
MMKNRKAFLGGIMVAAAAMGLFVFATKDTTVRYFPFIKNTAKQETMALPVNVTHAVKLPENIDFAGETVPLEDIEVRERLDRELLVNSYWQSATILMLKRANRYFPTIERLLKEAGIPEDFKYLALAESGLDYVVSPSGASGFWQFMKPAATQYGLQLDSEVDERYHLEKATLAACNYLRDAKEKTGSWTAAAAAYNMGLAGVLKQQQSQGETAYYHLLLNTETSRYVQRIVALKIIHQNQRDFGFYLEKEDLYPELKYTTMEVDSAVNWIAFAKENNISYKMLRIYNPWIRTFTLTNKAKKKYEVKIPA